MLLPVSIAFFLSYFLVLWLHTNAFVEYMSLLGVTWFKVAEYQNLEKEGYGGTYISFLSEYYKDKFIVRLLTCPLCLSFWLGNIAALFLGFEQNYIIAPTVLLFYLVFNKLL